MVNTTPYFPETLIRLPIWVLWRKEERKGKMTKVPYQINGRRASSTDSATWATHQDAVAAWQENPDQYDGIGSVMSKQYRTVFIDIDHCIQPDGSFDDRAEDILSAFMDDDGNLTTFSEISQSGEGLHLIVIGEIPGGFHNQKLNVEMYDSGRYIAMTGKAFSACEPSECANGLQYVYERYKTASTASESTSLPAADPSEGHTDDWIISHASDRGGQKFSALFKGDWSGYPSQSEADLALCKILAFWTDNNPEQIDRIFRQSEMYRAKWDREDYSTITIQKAIKTNDDTLSAFTQRKIREKSFQSLESLPQTVIDKSYVADRLKAIDPANSKAYNTLDDIASAQLFKAVFERYVRYNATAKSWYVYDGIRWKPDPGGLAVESYAKLLSRSLWNYSADKPGAFQTYALKLQARPKRKTLIDDARDLLPVCQEDFDTDPYLFNCQNGILNLKTFEFIDHDPDLLLSKVTNVVYDPDARCDVFETFMDQIMQGDRAKIEYLQTLFGYAMTGKNEREECFMLYGSTTRNGKGTLTNTIRYLFGDYGANIQPETLAMQKNRDGRTASGDIARLNGVRFLQMSEPPKRMKIDVALLKTMIGRDVITARHLYEREFEFMPCFTLFINTNFLPVVVDDTLFSSGRVKVITFDRHFNEAEQDHTLKDRLQTQESLSGILNWLLVGLKRYNANHGTVPVPESVQKATDDYRLKSDKIQNFIDEVLTPDKDATVRAKDVYVAFVDWCRSNGYYPENKKNFLSEFKAKGLLFNTGTVNGKTQHNVVKGYMIDEYVIGSGGI